MDTFQFKQLFLSHSIQNCLAKNNDIEKCKLQGTNMLKNITDGLLKGI